METSWCASSVHTKPIRVAHVQMATKNGAKLMLRGKGFKKQKNNKWENDSSEIQGCFSYAQFSVFERTWKDNRLWNPGWCQIFLRVPIGAFDTMFWKVQNSWIYWVCGVCVFKLIWRFFKNNVIFGMSACVYLGSNDAKQMLVFTCRALYFCMRFTISETFYKYFSFS